MFKKFSCLIFVLVFAITSWAEDVQTVMSYYRPDMSQGFIYISKVDMTLTLVNAQGKVVVTYPMACGKARGQKQRSGDNRTPEGYFRLQNIQDASQWGHDFHDGLGYIPHAYGPWFMRLQTGFKGIGIHGTHAPQSIGSRASEGCIRLRNEDLMALHRQVKVGMPVIICPEEGVQQLIANHVPSPDPEHGILLSGRRNTQIAATTKPQQGGSAKPASTKPATAKPAPAKETTTGKAAAAKESAPAKASATTVTPAQTAPVTVAATTAASQPEEKPVAATPIPETAPETDVVSAPEVEPAQPAIEVAEDVQPAVEEAEDVQPAVEKAEDAQPAVEETEESQPAIEIAEDDQPAEAPAGVTIVDGKLDVAPETDVEIVEVPAQPAAETQEEAATAEPETASAETPANPDNSELRYEVEVVEVTGPDGEVKYEVRYVPVK